MDISAFKNLSAYRMSLVDFMNNSGRNSHFDSVAQNLLNTVATRYGQAGATAQDSLIGDKVVLSEEAQTLLATLEDKEEQAKLTDTQKAAQSFLISFFDQSGVEPERLSDQALDIIDGLLGVIAGSGAGGRDITTDIAEMRYAENGKKVFTIAGDGARLRLAIEYAQDKTTPVKLSITDIAGGEVETASISLSPDEDGTMRFNIHRTQSEYRNGHMVKAGEIEPLSLRLYAA